MLAPRPDLAANRIDRDPGSVHASSVAVCENRRGGAQVRLNNANPVIAVVGSLNIDLIAYTQRVPNAGETLIGDDFRMGFGGKGANQAVMAARLGARVSMVGALGDDVYAEMTLENLGRQGVDARHVARVDG